MSSFQGSMRSFLTHFATSRLSPAVLFLVFLCGTISGCGGSGQDEIGSQSTSPATAPSGTVVINQVLLRALPTAVTHERFTGFDSRGAVRFGPEVRGKAASIELTGVSTSVTRLQIEYLAGTTVVGLGSVAVTVIEGQTTVVTDPPFQDVRAALVSLVVTPAQSTIANGSQQQFQAIGNFADGAQVDLTSSVNWTSSSSAVATIATGGLASSLSAGMSTITASLGPVSGNTTLTVSAATIASITVTPANPVIADGTTQQLTAMATLTDASTQNVTNTATWTSGNPANVTVNATGQVAGVAPGQSVVTAAVGAVSGNTTVTVNNASVTSIVVTPANTTIADGTTQQYTATANFTSGAPHDVTSSAVWTSDTPATATIAPGGLATAVDPGLTTITATFGGQSGNTTLTVSAATIARITVTPANPVIADGTTQQLTAMATLTDASTQNVTNTATWTSGNPATATIETGGQPSPGRSTALAPGQSTITATVGAVSGNTVLTVTPASIASIAISPPLALSAPGSKQQYTATATLSDNSTQDVTSQVIWSSDNTSVIIPNDNLGPNTVGQARVNLGAATGTTALISATLGALNSQSTLRIHRFAYVADSFGSRVQAFIINANGSLSANGTVGSGDAPRSVAVDPSGRFAYVANLSDDTVSMYIINADGTLTANGTAATGNAPFSIAMDPSGRFVFVANVSDDTVSAFIINSDGTLAANGAPATGSLPVSVTVDPSGRFAYVVNTSDNNISAFAINTDGTLTANGTFATGARPSSVAADPSGRFLYISSRDTDNVFAYTINSDGTLTANGTFAAGSGPERVVVDPSGRFAYVLESSSVFAYIINSDGTLTANGNALVGRPFSLTIDPSGRYLYTANRNTNNISQFVLDADGTLTANGVLASSDPVAIVTSP